MTNRKAIEMLNQIKRLYSTKEILDAVDLSTSTRKARDKET